MHIINIKRIYLPSEKSDGFRILVDRLWPRGVSKESARLDLWLKDIAPSTELRQWFHTDNGTDKWEVFKGRYLGELKNNAAVDQLKKIMEKSETVTLLFSVNDETHNHALILRDFISG